EAEACACSNCEAHPGEARTEAGTPQEKGRLAAVSLAVEGSGETVGEAKWNALRELERRAPALDKAAVRFQVLTEGERGLLGVGYTPAPVLASVSGESAAATEPRDESPLAARARSLVEHVTAAMGLRCAV